jgi:chaperonin GroEL
MTVQSIPGVVFKARAREGMQRGVNQLVDAVRPTLGPCPRVVAVEHTFRHRTPELLDNAGVITRRIIELADRGADVGAMLLRHLLWRVHEEAGDGTATAAILFQAVYNRGMQYLAAGGDGMALRRHLERGLNAILAELERQTLPVQGQARLTELAASLCFDEPLAHVLGEVFAIVGEHGLAEIRSGQSRGVERQYTEGAYWSGGALSQLLLADQTRLRSDLADVAVLISDLDLDDPRQLMPLIAEAMQRGVGSLLVVAASTSDTITAMLLAASRDPERFRAVAVKTPGLGLVEQAEALEDLATLTGGRRLLKAAGDTLRGLTVDGLGRARRAWCDRNYTGIIGGKGDPRELRRQLAALKAALAHTDEPLQQGALRKRIGRLSGGSALITVGGATESEITLREERAKRTAELLRAALREGVVPGGGVALLACRPRLRAMLEASADLDAQVAFRILLRAVEEPLRVIAGNSGHEPADVLARLQGAAEGVGLDALSNSVVDMAEAGIYDVAAAQKVAIRAAISGAATALTVDTVVHKRNPVSAAGKP